MMRLWEIDFLRGIAIMLMVIFHAGFDFTYFTNQLISSPLWLLFARVIASLFLILVGISLTLSYNKIQLTPRETYKKYLKRGGRIFLWGIFITIITFIFMPQGFIMFGVLHLIGISIVLSIPFLRFKLLPLILGIVITTAGLILSQFSFTFSHLLWLGFQPSSFYTFDYFPILPWFGLVLIGIFLGNTLYPKYKRLFRLPNLGKKPLIRDIIFLGQHSLIIYLIHQPVLIAILFLLNII